MTPDQKIRRYLLLLTLFSYTLTFVGIRIATFLQKIEVLPNQDGDVHIHHMVTGIILLLFLGFMSTAFPTRKPRPLPTVLFGIAAALTIDEFALWVFVRDVYWASEGMISIYAGVIAFAVICITIFINELTIKRPHRIWNRRRR